MSRADELYRATCLDILENGFYDTELEVRPRWADGTPAHTVKKFGVVIVIAHLIAILSLWVDWFIF